MIMPNVTIGQQVRAGIDVVPLERVVVEDHVMIGAGARIIASGTLVIGSGSAVGANAVVTRSIPAGVTVVGIPTRIVSDVGAPERLASGVVDS